jgi:hypothetical protein
MDRDEMSTLYRGPPIDASYQVSLHLAERFQRRRLKCEKLTDDGRQVMAKAQIAFGKVEFLITGSFPHNNFSSVYWILTKLGHMITLWKGKNRPPYPIT